jgi:hypothetical protein
MIIYEKKSNRRIFNFQIDFSLRLNHIKKGFALGTYSICKDGKHVIYLDYDNFRIEWLIDELEHFIDKYELSSFYIFSSSHKDGRNNYHVVCFDKVTPEQYNDLVRESNADSLFKNNDMFDLKNSRVLRFSGKTKSSIDSPMFFKKIESNYNYKEKSTAHIRFYQKIFNVDIDDYNGDGNEEINIISYATANL